MPSKKILDWAKSKKGNIQIITDPVKAVKGADCIMCDKWISMGDNVNVKKKKKELKPYQVNEKLMSYAAKDAIFMHVLPAAREEEVVSSVIDGKQSVVWLQAENRLHGQKAIIDWCLS